jgi:hypothetical protein
MVGVIAKLENPQSKLSDMLGMSLGQGIGSGLNTFFANRSLESVLHDKALERAPQSKKMEALQSALSPYGEKGQEILQQRMLIDKQEREEKELAKTEDEKEVLGRILAGEKVSNKDMAKVKPENQLKLKEIQQKTQFGKNVYQNLIDAGYPESTAKLWQSQIENSTIGGLSDTIKEVNKLLSRSGPGRGVNGENAPTNQLKPSIDIPGTNLGALELDFPELPEPVGLNSADVVKMGTEHRKTNTPLYNDTVDRLNALDDEYREVKHLQELNEIPGALPTGAEKWNVDWDTGDLRVKALATPEAQDYVKTIARMARRAKDFFPGRVTNFDLDQFKQGFPTLANSPEGRRLIAEQLSLGNRIAYLKDETFKAAMDHYGSGADPVLVKKYATENYRKLKSQLEEQLKQTNARARQMVDKESSKKGRPSLDEIFQ